MSPTKQWIVVFTEKLLAKQKTGERLSRADSLQAWQNFNKNRSYGQDIIGRCFVDWLSCLTSYVHQAYDPRAVWTVTECVSGWWITSVEEKERGERGVEGMGKKERMIWLCCLKFILICVCFVDRLCCLLLVEACFMHADFMYSWRWFVLAFLPCYMRI